MTAQKTNGLRIPFSEWLYRMSEADVPYQARALAVYAVAFKVTTNEELACLVGMDTKGVADKTYNKWKRWLSDHGWVIVKQVTVGRLTTVEVCPAYQEIIVSFTDLTPRDPRKYCEPSSVPITDMRAAESTDETGKVTDEKVEITAEAGGLPCAPARIEPPSGVNISLENSKLARDLPSPSPALAGLNGSADPMLADIVKWMPGGTEANARNWLASIVSQLGQEAVRNSYVKLKTDLATGSLIAKPLQTWTKIAQRMKSDPSEGAESQIDRIKRLCAEVEERGVRR